MLIYLVFQRKFRPCGEGFMFA